MKKLILTNDGSFTVFSEKFKSTYHSVYGAITESRHIYLNAGLDYWIKNTKGNTPHILEYGFGTGLNAFLSLLYSIENRTALKYTALEAYPLGRDEIEQLRYAEKINPEFKNHFLQLHSSPFSEYVAIGNTFLFRKIKTLFEEYESDEKYDIIYFDPFDAGIQENIWQRPFLDTVIAKMNRGAVLVTYGAKGSFKRSLKALGLEVHGIPGPPGKREITRAVKR